MHIKLIFTASLFAALVCGCATTQSIQQGKDLSASAIAYADAVENLLAITTEKVIDFDSSELIKTRIGSDPRRMITQKNDALINVVSELYRFRTQTKLLKTYFISLQALADSPVKNDAGVAVKSLTDSISKLNETLEGESGTESLSEDQKTQIGELGGLVVNTIHSAKVKNALERDAEVIGMYLALQENQLGNITDILDSRFQAENDFFRNKKVIAPYADKSNPLPSSWAENRKQWVESQFINQRLKTAKETAKQLGGVWANILQGKSDVNSLSVLISDVNQFVMTIQALEEADNIPDESK